MKKIFLQLLLISLLVAEPGFAGYAEGMASYKKDDYASALREFKPLAEQGDSHAQATLGFMYANGHGVPQDYQQALIWFRKAALQGEAYAQNSLGIAYANGQGVAMSRVVAYALYNLSAAQAPSYNTGAAYKRATLANEMTAKEIEAAQKLTREMAKPGNLLKALDRYDNKWWRFYDYIRSFFNRP